MLPQLCPDLLLVWAIHGYRQASVFASPCWVRATPKFRCPRQRRFVVHAFRLPNPHRAWSGFLAGSDGGSAFLCFSNMPGGVRRFADIRAQCNRKPRPVRGASTFAGYGSVSFNQSAFGEVWI